MATKWGVFVITKVRYDKEKKFITKVVRSEYLCEKLGKEEIVSRSVVIDGLNCMTTYVTAVLDKSGKQWSLGESVKSYKQQDGDEFIKTAANNRKEDNLGELPVF